MTLKGPQDATRKDLVTFFGKAKGLPGTRVSMLRLCGLVILNPNTI